MTNRCEERQIMHNLQVRNRDSRLDMIVASSDPRDIVRLHLRIGEFVDEATRRASTDRKRKK